jgi:hypothetical protein
VAPFAARRFRLGRTALILGRAEHWPHHGNGRAECHGESAVKDTVQVCISHAELLFRKERPP